MGCYQNRNEKTGVGRGNFGKSLTTEIEEIFVENWCYFSGVYRACVYMSYRKSGSTFKIDLPISQLDQLLIHRRRQYVGT